MNKTKDKFPVKKVIQGLIQKGKDFFIKNQRKFFILGLISFLYFFAVVIYHVSSKMPQAPEPKKQISELYLQQYTKD